MNEEQAGNQSLQVLQKGFSKEGGRPHHSQYRELPPDRGPVFCLFGLFVWPAGPATVAERTPLFFSGCFGWSQIEAAETLTRWELHYIHSNLIVSNLARLERPSQAPCRELHSLPQRQCLKFQPIFSSPQDIFLKCRLSVESGAL